MSFTSQPVGKAVKVFYGPTSAIGRLISSPIVKSQHFVGQATQQRKKNP
jgi:hypothetical protein